MPVGIVSAGANRHDSPLLEPTIQATKRQVGVLPTKPVMHLDSGYDGKPSRLLAEHDLLGEIAKKGIPSPIQVGTRWVVERTHSWMNNFGKLRRCTDRDGTIVDFYLYLAAAFVTLPASAADPAQLIQSTAAEVIEIIKTTTPGPARQAAIQRVLQTNFDLPYMGQQALGANWNKASEVQRTRFLKAAETAEARAYSERFGQYGGQTLSVGKVTPKPNGLFIVDSRLSQSNGQPIKLEWEVRDAGQGPRITDVKVEGVSMVMTRRSDFNSYIQRNGGTVDPLINELESRAAR